MTSDLPHLPTNLAAFTSAIFSIPSGQAGGKEEAGINQSGSWRCNLEPCCVHLPEWGFGRRPVPTSFPVWRASLCAETESTLQDGIGGWESDTRASTTMPGAAWPPAGLPPSTLRPLPWPSAALHPVLGLAGRRRRAGLASGAWSQKPRRELVEPSGAVGLLWGVTPGVGTL